jgi:hypothetical protein
MNRGHHVIGFARMIFIVAACWTLVAIACSLSLVAQQAATKPKRVEIGGETPVKSMLWVGNSFF